MKIYFSGSMTGAPPDSKLYEQIIAELSKYGKVLTEHISDGPTDYVDPTEDTTIYETDMAWLMDCDIVFADVSYPSIGVGYEIGVAEALEKPIICAYKKDSKFKRSAMLGSEHIQHVTYLEFEDLAEQIEVLFKQ